MRNKRAWRCLLCGPPRLHPGVKPPEPHELTISAVPALSAEPWLMVPRKAGFVQAAVWPGPCAPAAACTTLLGFCSACPSSSSPCCMTTVKSHSRSVSASSGSAANHRGAPVWLPGLQAQKLQPQKPLSSLRGGPRPRCGPAERLEAAGAPCGCCTLPASHFRCGKAGHVAAGPGPGTP